MKQPAAILVLPVFYQNLPVSAILVNTSISVSSRIFQYLQYGSWMLHLFKQSVPITTKVVNSNTVHGEVYSIQYYVIKFDLR